MNLGYACINSTLSAQKQKITTNRSMIKKTFIERGVDYAGELSMLNVADLSAILKWNVNNGIKFFRLSSELFPWASEYKFTDLPQYQSISKLLSIAGEFAKKNELRITSHPVSYTHLTLPTTPYV